jgi:MarR family
VTVVVDRLERAGLIRRVRDAGDRRNVWLEVTPAATEAMGELFEPMIAEARRRFDRYSTKELEMTDFVMARELTEAHNERLPRPRGHEDQRRGDEAAEEGRGEAAEACGDLRSRPPEARRQADGARAETREEIRSRSPTRLVRR